MKIIIEKIYSDEFSHWVQLRYSKGKLKSISMVMAELTNTWIHATKIKKREAAAKYLGSSYLNNLLD